MHHRVEQALWSMVHRSMNGEIMPASLREGLSRHLSLAESGPLIWLLTQLAMRGTPVHDIARYATTREAKLPLRGCEEQLLDPLLTALEERTGDRAEATCTITAIATIIEQMISAIEQQSGVSRDLILSWLDEPESHDGPENHV